MKNKVLAGRVENEIYDRVIEKAKVRNIKISKLVSEYITMAVMPEDQGKIQAPIPKNAPDQNQGKDDDNIEVPEYGLRVSKKGLKLFLDDVRDGIVNPFVKDIISNRDKILKELEAIADLIASFTGNIEDRETENVNPVDAKDAPAIDEKPKLVKDDQVQNKKLDDDTTDATDGKTEEFQTEFRPVMHITARAFHIDHDFKINEKNPICPLCGSRRMRRGRLQYECLECQDRIQEIRNREALPKNDDASEKPDEDRDQEIQDKKKDKDRAQEYRVGTGDVSDEWD